MEKDLKESSTAFLTALFVKIQEYCNENNLSLTKDYRSFFKFDAYNSFDKKADLELFLFILQKEQGTIHLHGEQGVFFIKSMLEKLDENNKQELITNKYKIFGNLFLIKSLSDNMENITKFFVALSENKKLFSNWDIKYFERDLKDNVTNEQYDILIDILLSKQQHEFNKKKSKLIINNMLASVQNEEIVNKYQALIPDNEKITDFFEVLDVDCFDLNVSKDKLSKVIPLRSEEDYNYMHLFTIKQLNDAEFKKMNNIVAIDGEPKYKSSKYYRYIVRVKKEGEFNKEKMKILLNVCYQLYISKSTMYTEVNAKVINSAYLKHKLDNEINSKEIKKSRNKI